MRKHRHVRVTREHGAGLDSNGLANRRLRRAYGLGYGWAIAAVKQAAQVRLAAYHVASCLAGWNPETCADGVTPDEYLTATPEETAA